MEDPQGEQEATPAFLFRRSQRLSLRCGSQAQIVLPQRFGEPFDSVAEHSARHGAGVPLEKGLFRREVAFADFAQHPANRLVHQILAVTNQPLCDVQRVRERAAPDEMERRQDRDTPFPEKR